jgi:hypothetical protein
MRKIPYSDVVGNLMHAMVCMCPNLVYVVHHISQFMSNLGKEHWVATNCILWYIKTSFTLGIMYWTFFQPNIRIGWCDSNWVGNLDNKKSNIGYLFQNVRSLISWQLKKQSTIVLSSIEVEYMVVANAIKEAIWLQKLVFNFGFCPLQSIPFIAITNHALS